MLSSFFDNFFAPRVPASIGEWILAVLLGVLLTCVVRFLLAWFIVTLRGFGGGGLWEGEEVIYDTKVWADLATTLLWASVIGYCIFNLTYQHALALIPYGAAMLAGFVFAALSIRRLTKTIATYRRAVRR